MPSFLFSHGMVNSPVTRKTLTMRHDLDAPTGLYGGILFGIVM